MFDIGFWELSIIGIVALLVIGPERLPAVARTVGKYVGRANRFIANGESMEVLKVLNKEKMYGFQFADVNIRFVNDRIPDIDIKVWMDCLQTQGSALPQGDVRSLYYSVMEDYHAQGESKNAKQLTMSDPFFNALQVKFSYAVTCHKAQGGQWSAVFIDHGYLTDDMVDENLLRWFYTAITRATEKVYLVNFNEMFF